MDRVNITVSAKRVKLVNIVEFVKLLSNKNISEKRLKKRGSGEIVKSLKEYIKRCADVHEKQ
jgi:hypothetical protein